MARLDEALERATDSGDAVFVSIPNGTPDELGERLGHSLAGRQVVSLQCGDECPDEETLEKTFSDGLGQNRVLHVAIGRHLHPRLLEALVEVVADDRIPGPSMAAAPADRLLVVSAQVRWLTELDDDLGQYFPIQVGAVEWQK